MPLRPKTVSRAGRHLGVALSLAAAVPLHAAAPVPPAVKLEQPISIVARDQPLADFLRDLFARADQPVITSAALTGTINGTFTGGVTKIFKDISRAFNLVGYHDGAAYYIYPASELTVRTISGRQADAARVRRAVGAMGIADDHNSVRASPDGTLVVAGTPRFIEQVGALARGDQPGAPGTRTVGAAPRLPYDGLDMGPAPARPMEFRVFYLRYARAEDTTISAGGREVRVPGLATIIQNLVLDRPIQFGAQPVAATGFGSRPLRQSQPRLKGLGLDAIPPDTQYANLPVLGLQPGAGTLEAAAPPPPPADANSVRIQANPYLNALIIRDVPERMAGYESLVRALDVEPQLVEIEATIIDIDTNKLRQLGINWRFGSGGFGALFGNGDQDSDTRLLPIPGSRRDNVSNVTPSGNGLNLSTIIGSNREFIARVTALETKGAARIVSRPQVMTLSNVEAVFDRTRTFYVRVAGRAEVDLFNVTAGTVLRVNPHVFRDHDQTRIRVLIGIEDGNITSDEVQSIPVVERASVTTQAMIVDGESLLLGGMTVDSDIDSLDKIPLLGDVPILGELFKNRTRQHGRIERLFLITPRIATLTQRLATAAPQNVPEKKP